MEKDLYPAVREEWMRLQAVETTEKNCQENQGFEIQLGIKEKKLYRDGVIIYTLKVNYFLIDHKNASKFLSWNISPLRTKMKISFVMEILQDFDIVG